MIPVYLPKLDDPQALVRLPSRAGEGAALVGDPGKAPEGMVQITWQSRSEAVNIVNYADRVQHAACSQRHPTSKMCWMNESDLIEIGIWDENEGRVILTAPGAAELLARWLGKQDVGDEELMTQSSYTHTTRRQLRSMMADPAQRIQAQLLARQLRVEI